MVHRPVGFCCDEANARPGGLMHKCYYYYYYIQSICLSYGHKMQAELSSLRTQATRLFSPPSDAPIRERPSSKYRRYWHCPGLRSVSCAW